MKNNQMKRNIEPSDFFPKRKKFNVFKRTKKEGETNFIKQGNLKPDNWYQVVSHCKHYVFK